MGGAWEALKVLTVRFGRPPGPGGLCKPLKGFLFLVWLLGHTCKVSQYRPAKNHRTPRPEAREGRRHEPKHSRNACVHQSKNVEALGLYYI